MAKENTTKNSKKNNDRSPKLNSTITIVIIVLVILFLIFFATKLVFDNINKSKSGQFSVFGENGERINTSNKLKSSKKVNNLTLDNISIKYIENQTILSGNLTNNSDEKKENINLEITLLDSHGDVIDTLNCFVESLEPNETQDLNVSIDKDLIDIYDFNIKII